MHALSTPANETPSPQCSTSKAFLIEPRGIYRRQRCRVAPSSHRPTRLLDMMRFQWAEASCPPQYRRGHVRSETAGHHSSKLQEYMAEIEDRTIPRISRS